MLATDSIKALRVRTLIQQSWRDLYAAGIDAIVAPTLPAVAAKSGQEAFTWPDGSEEPVINACVRTCCPGNLTGLPALSIPCGFSATGLPIGLQVIGAPCAEQTVLAIGQAHESTAD